MKLANLASNMLNIQAIHDAIDAFVLKGGPEAYHIDIPEQKPRGYLGMSALGEECVRKTWFGFRKVAKTTFPSRMLRLFRTGDIYEFRIIYLLRGIGFEVFERDENGKQFKATDFGGHLSGSMDGVGKAPEKFGYDKPFLLEFKTVNDKGFQKYLKDGVKKTNAKYYAQLMLYCGYNDLESALFIAVNKNDETLHMEHVPFDKFAFRRLVDRAEHILSATESPERISSIPSWWACSFCEFKGVCHGGEPAIKSCRSCKFAVPAEEGKWECTKGQKLGEVCGKYKDITK